MKRFYPPVLLLGINLAILGPPVFCEPASPINGCQIVSCRTVMAKDPQDLGPASHHTPGHPDSEQTGSLCLA